MFFIIKTEHDDSGMSQRFIGSFSTLETAWSAIKKDCNKLFRSISRKDFAGYSYKSRGENEYMAWIDVVCSGGTHSFTWSIFDNEQRNATHGRWIG